MSLDPQTPLAEQTGPRFWRGLEELLDTEAFQALLKREYPEQAGDWTDPVTRRQFLMLLGASLALAGVAGCSTQPAPREKIMPYVRQPEGMVLGKPLYFASAMCLAGVATGVLVESHEGRPTKIEGNPSHPASLGATDLFAQASVLGLYDPDRSQSVTYRGRPRAWNEALSALRAALDKQRSRKGAGLRILTGNVTSPTLAAQMRELREDFPEAKWYQYEPAGRSAVLEGGKLAFGEYVNTIYDFKKADVVLSLDADFLACGPGTLRYTHDYSERRRAFRQLKTPGADVKRNRLYVVECGMTSTGGVADHRLALKASQVETFARALAAGLKVADAPKPSGDLPAEAQRWLGPLARDLQAHPGASIILAGDGQPPAVHALVHAINHALGNHGKTVRYTSPIEARPVDHEKELAALVEEMSGRRVEVLAILDCNPVYDAPVDLKFAEALVRVPLRVHLGLYRDETALLCDWHIPEAHYLESWGDARAYDGTVSLIQPLIAPLYRGRSVHELIAAFSEEPERAGDVILRTHWRNWWHENGGSGDFESFWQRSLQDGLIADTALPARTVELRKGWGERAAAAAPAVTGGKLEIVFRPDPTLFDGRFANNGWLQELPKPVTKLTWDNAAIMSPKTAEKLGIPYVKGSSAQPGHNGGEHGQAIVHVVVLVYGSSTVQASAPAPVWIQPGHADDAVTVHLGHGRLAVGHVGNGIGFSAYALRTSRAPWFDGGLEVLPLNKEHTLACTQMHHSMEERRPIRTASLEHFQKHPKFAQEGAHKEESGDRRLKPLTLYDEAEKEFPYNGYKWAMAIDLTTCIGCSACVVACQAENNIPVVGKTEVTRGHEMHWLRIDRYYTDKGDPLDANQVSAHFQPVPCQQCEKAPCELVCPVGATVHSHDGLNDMIYNRCVGTRYCSNNCPYKVRRFNFLLYSDFTTESLKLMRNPEVTVRSRGVMEKCTYCVQRIRVAEIEAEREHRRVRDGEVMTACQAACPAKAIVFGDLNDKESGVVHWKEEPLDYALLAELNTQPRTTYLAALRNPNPELEA